MPKVDLSAEGKDLMAKMKYDQGIVAFGTKGSDSTVKISTALALAKKKERWVLVSFNGEPATEASVGVTSKDWALCTAGKSVMPALAINGTMYMGGDDIVKMLAEEAGASKPVMSLIELSRVNSDRMMEGVKHWGWSAFHEKMDYAMVNKEHYIDYGYGKKDLEWEEETVKIIHTFMLHLEQVLAGKPKINGYYIGHKLTYADCALFNWPVSIGFVTGLNIQKRYPKVYANWLILREQKPVGSDAHFNNYPSFCEGVTAANKYKRDEGFDVNDPKYWVNMGKIITKPVLNQGSCACVII